MSVALPDVGQSDWGQPLNDYLTQVLLAQANLAESTIINHQVAVDPHGDRAYTNGLITPITSLVNQPSGYVVLDSSGFIPNSLLPSAGGLSDVYDVSSSAFGGHGVPGVDNTTPIQNALIACKAAGGGEVWVPNGTWMISSTLVGGNNTWLHLSPGAKLIRGVNPSTGLKPAVMYSNFNSSTTKSSITGNMIVSGGIWDATNGGTQVDACTPIKFANAAFVLIGQSQFIVKANSSSAAIGLYGVSQCVVETSGFVTATPVSTANTIPAVLVAAASSAELPTGLQSSMYSNATCSMVSMTQNVVNVPTGGYFTSGGNSYSGFSGMIGSLVAPASGSHTSINISDSVVNGCVNGVADVQAGSWTNVTMTGLQAFHGFMDSTGTQSTAHISTSTSSGIKSDSSNNFNLDITTWHTMGSFSSAWAASGSGVNGLFYRISEDLESIEVIFDVAWTGGTTGSTTVCTLPGIFVPSKTVRLNVGGISSLNYTSAWFSSGVFQLVTQGSHDSMFGHVLLPRDL